MMEKANILFVMHLQQIPFSANTPDEQPLLKELDVVKSAMRVANCPYIVNFYGSLFREVSLLQVHSKATLCS